MQLDSQTVQKIAKLARIRLKDEEVEHFRGELSAILNWVEQLSEVNTEGVPQLASVSDVSLPWRKDEVTDGGYQEDIVANAPKTEHGCFVVPKVIE